MNNGAQWTDDGKCVCCVACRLFVREGQPDRDRDRDRQTYSQTYTYTRKYARARARTHTTHTDGDVGEEDG